MYTTIQKELLGVIVYGIEGYGKQIWDLSANRTAVENLAHRCRIGELVPWQLIDVAQDFVAEASFHEPEH